MYQRNEKPSAAEEQVQQHQGTVQKVCDSADVTSVQLQQILRTSPDDVMVSPGADPLHVQATRQPRRQAPENGSAYMAAHWPEIHEWLTFPRGLGVWCAVLIAAFATQPLPAVVLGVVLCGLMNALAIALWEAGHEEGGRRRVHGDAKWWWKISRPLRMVVAHWGFRWFGVAFCLLAAWAGGMTFDGWWLPLALLLTYDVVRTLQTAENGPCAQ